MKRVRLGTLMLLIVIAALAVALVMERNRSSRLEQQLPKYIEYIEMPIDSADSTIETTKDRKGERE